MLPPSRAFPTRRAVCAVTSAPLPSCRFRAASGFPLGSTGLHGFAPCERPLRRTPLPVSDARCSPGLPVLEPRVRRGGCRCRPCRRPLPAPSSPASPPSAVGFRRCVRSDLRQTSALPRSPSRHAAPRSDLTSAIFRADMSAAWMTGSAHRCVSPQGMSTRGVQGDRFFRCFRCGPRFPVSAAGRPRHIASGASRWCVLAPHAGRPVRQALATVASESSGCPYLSCARLLACVPQPGPSSQVALRFASNGPLLPDSPGIPAEVRSRPRCLFLTRCSSTA